jgi:hypothetical protein
MAPVRQLATTLRPDLKSEEDRIFGSLEQGNA